MTRRTKSVRGAAEKVRKEYDLRYVAFVDILAFASIVERSERDVLLIRNISEALKVISRRVANARSTELGLEATAFSDTVVFSVPISADGLLHMLQAIDDLSMELLSKNMLFRGAVVKGKILHTAEAVFGPALLHAYKLESAVSFHPRIMVSAEVYSDAASKNYRRQELTPRYIVADKHDVPYLNLFARWHGAKSNWSKDTIEKLVTLQTIIATGLIENANSPPINEKYKWIARRLNVFIRSAGLQNKIAEIPLEETDK
jgi:class 3 adenylate cyclase